MQRAPIYTYLYDIYNGMSRMVFVSTAQMAKTYHAKNCGTKTFHQASNIEKDEVPS